MKHFNVNKSRIITCALLLFFTLHSLDADAQRRRIRVRSSLPTDTLSAFSRAYLDSLQIYRDSLDHALRVNDSLRTALAQEAGKATSYSRMTMPLTFYHDVAGRQLSLSQTSDNEDYSATVDRLLLDAYLNRPDLVADSEKQLNAMRGNVPKQEGPVRQESQFTEDAPVTTPDVGLDIVAPVDMVVEKPNFWTRKGDYSLQFIQNFVSKNWYKGGESNYSMIAAAILEANYDNKQKVKWDNKLELKLGLQTSPGDTIHQFKTSEDLIRLTSKLGLQATKRWYYTVQMIGYTQFVRGYKSNDKMVYSDFLSPANINLSLGMDYKVEWLKKHLTGTINISPLAYNFRYVGRLGLAARYGLKESHHTLHDFGSTFTADLQWKFTDNIIWKTRLYGYTTYKRVEVEWENTLNLQINRYIATKLFLYPRFDDGAVRDAKHGYLQFKEYLSLGFSYTY